MTQEWVVHTGRGFVCGAGSRGVDGLGDEPFDDRGLAKHGGKVDGEQLVVVDGKLSKLLLVEEKALMRREEEGGAKVEGEGQISTRVHRRISTPMSLSVPSPDPALRSPFSPSLSDLETEEGSRSRGVVRRSGAVFRLCANVQPHLDQPLHHVEIP